MGRDSMDRLVRLCHRKRIDIACIQETHNSSNDVYEIQNYTIIMGGNDVEEEEYKGKKAGVAIAIKSDIVQYVKTIQKIDGRTMEMRIHTGGSIKDISIFNTYAPHTGYSTDVIQKYWDKTNAYISLIPRKYIKIWCTDNNGQLYRKEQNEQNVGTW